MANASNERQLDMASTAAPTRAQRGLLLGGTLLTAMFLVVRPMAGPKYYTLENGFSGFVLTLLAFCIAAYVLLRKRATLPDSLTLLLILWTGLMGWGALRAPHLGAAVPVLSEMLGYGLVMLCGFLIVRQEPGLFPVLCRVLVGIICVEAYYGIWQSLFDFPRLVADFQAGDPVFEQLRSSAGEARLKSGNIFGSFVNPNLLAAYILIGLGLIGGMLFDQPEKPSAGFRRFARTIFATALLIMMLVALWLTDSKGGIVAAIAGAWFFAVQRICATKPQLGTLLTRATVAGIVLLVIILLLATFGMLGRQPLGLSMEVRFDYWRAALRMIADHPLQGVGLAGFAEHYSFYKLPSGTEVQDTHNDYLQLLAELGVAAVAAYGAIWFVALRWPRNAPLPTIGNDAGAQKNTSLHWIALAGALLGFFFMFMAFTPYNILDVLALLDGKFSTDTLLAALHTLSMPVVFVCVYLGLAPQKLSGSQRTIISHSMIHGVRAGIGAVLVHQLVDFDFRAQAVAGSIFLLGGMLLALRTQNESAPASVLSKILRFVLPIMTLALLPLTVYFPFFAGVVRSDAVSLEARADNRQREFNPQTNATEAMSFRDYVELRKNIVHLRRRSVETTPFDAEAWLDLGIALEQLRQVLPDSVTPSHILECFEKAEQRRPFFPGPKITLGTFYLRQGTEHYDGSDAAQQSLRRAADFYGAASRRYPLHPGMKIWQGDALLLAMDATAAASAYYDAFKIDMQISDLNVAASTLFTDARPSLFLRHDREKNIRKDLDETLNDIETFENPIAPMFIKGLRFRKLFDTAWQVHVERQSKEGISPPTRGQLYDAADNLVRAMETPAELAHAAMLRALAFHLAKNTESESAQRAWEFAKVLQQKSVAAGEPGTPPAMFERLYRWYAK
jgi:O-antigen ligase